MQDTFNQLRDSLGQILKLHKSRLACFTNMLLGLMTSQTLNLYKIATHFCSNAQIDSSYRRIQSFIKEVRFDYDAIALWCFEQFIPQDTQVYLSMDRTNWQWGKSNINILMLSVNYEGIAIPLYWEILNHRGNSDHSVRINLLERFINQFGTECIAGLLADREFIGQSWLKWLKYYRIPFVIRVKNNLICKNKQGGKIKLSDLFRDLKPGDSKSLDHKRRLFDLPVYITAIRSQSGELVIVISTDNHANALAIYSKRWEIENLFQALKGRGFNFEHTHITDPDKISKLTGLLAIAFCWSHKAGEYKDHKISSIKRKSHGRLQSTYFRYGLNMIIQAYHKIGYCLEQFKICLKIFANPIPKINL